MKKMISQNGAIRETASSSGVKLWQIANELGISEYAFSRRLRFELSPEEQERIFRIIDNLKKEQGAEA